MGSTNVDLGVLLKNIEEGLKIYSVSELNDALVKTLSYKHDKSAEIQYVLNIVCNEFDITEYALKKTKNRGHLQDARQTAYALLHLNLGLAVRFISESIFFNWHNSVTYGLKRFQKLDVSLKQDREFLARYQRLQEKLLKFIQNKTTNQDENLLQERQEEL